MSKPIIQFMFTVSMLLSTGAGMLVGMELGYLWYSYLIASVIEALLIVFFHRMGRLKFELKTV